MIRDMAISTVSLLEPWIDAPGLISPCFEVTDADCFQVQVHVYDVIRRSLFVSFVKR
jgi:hypothetical protein